MRNRNQAVLDADRAYEAQTTAWKLLALIIAGAIGCLMVFAYLTVGPVKAAGKSDIQPKPPSFCSAPPVSYDLLILQVLEMKFGQKPAFEGMIMGAMPTQIFVNPKTWTWTQIAVTEPGRACIMIMGDSFALAQVPGRRGS